MRKTLSIFFVSMVSSALVFSAQAAEKGKGSIKKSEYGRTPDGKTVDLYTLTNAKGMVAKLITYGAICTELHTPDRNGKLGDIVLGFDNLQQFQGEHPYFGSTIGRVANRIAKGKFTLAGKDYTLAVNNGPNSLHGGLKGFNRVLWKAEPREAKDSVAVKFSYLSPNGEEGYPGNLTVTVTYILTDKNELKIEYTASTDQTTILNLTHHGYFNLACEGDILGHQMTLAADRFTPVDDTLIPTGELAKVKGTPMDFTKPMVIGSRIGQLTNDPRGYDHNYVLNKGDKKLGFALRVYEPKSGRQMELYTTEPGLQFYTGNFLDGSLKGKYGVIYKKHFGFCVEADHFPDSIHHPNFPSIVLKPGEKYQQTTIHKFSAH